MEQEVGPRVSGLGAALVLIALAVALAAMLASRLVGWTAGCWDVAWTAAAVSAVMGTFLARRRALSANRGRWTLWVLAAGCWLLGQIGWDVFGVIGFVPSPSIADAGWWAFALLVMVSMVRSRGPRGLQMVAVVESSTPRPPC